MQRERDRLDSQEEEEEEEEDGDLPGGPPTPLASR